MKIRFVLTVLFALICGTAQAQSNVRLELEPQRDTILIGDQINLKITAISTKNEYLAFPEFGKDSGIEVLETGAIDTVKLHNDSVFRLERRYLITAFDAGVGSFGKLPIVRLSISGNIDTLYSNDLSFIIKNIDLNEDFQPYDIKDIKTYPSLLWLWISLGILGGLIIIGLIIFLLKKYAKPKEIIPFQKINPFEWAVSELTKLKNSNISVSRTKEYYSQLTDIVKEYIELQTEVSVMEKTSDEILTVMPSTIFADPKLVKNLADLFQIADLVKFAKYSALISECETGWLDAYNFVTQSNIIANEIKQSKNEEHAAGDTAI